MVKFHITGSKLTKKQLSAITFNAKYQISKSRGQVPPSPFLTSMVAAWVSTYFYEKNGTYSVRTFRAITDRCIRAASVLLCHQHPWTYYRSMDTIKPTKLPVVCLLINDKVFTKKCWTFWWKSETTAWNSQCEVFETFICISKPFRLKG